MTMDGLLDLGGSLWPERHRYLADTLWTNAPAARGKVQARFRT
jgi:hypothetical protein